MNPKFMDMVKRHTPTVDPRLAEGVAYTTNKNYPKEIDRLFRINSEAFPKGLTYTGYREATPLEGYTYATRVHGNNVRQYNINKSDIRLYAFLFNYRGHQIKKYIYLPFVRRFGQMHLNGVRYTVSPVISDGVMTVKDNEIFVKLVKMKLWFERLTYQCYIDGKIESGYVYHSSIHNKPSDKSSRPIKMNSTLVHYLCCKFGLTKTLELLGITDFQVLEKEWIESNRKEYDKLYPESKYIEVKSTGKKPKHTYLINGTYKPSELVVLVNREEYTNNPDARNVMVTLFYIFDHFPSLKRMNSNVIDDIESWRYMLGDTIYGADEHISVIKEGIDKHMVSIDGYVDEIVREDFARNGTPEIVSAYHLFVYIIKNFNRLVSGVGKTTIAAKLYDKQLQVSRYLLAEINSAINLAYFGLSGLKIEENLNPNKVPTLKEVENIIKRIHTESILKFKKNTQIMVSEDPTDLPLLKLVRMVVLQERSDKERTQQGANNINDPLNILHVSLVEVGAAYDMVKSDPSGHNRLNLFSKIDDEFIIRPNKDLESIIDNVDKDLHAHEGFIEIHQDIDVDYDVSDSISN